MFIRGLLTLVLMFLTVLPLPDPAHAATAYVQGCGFASGAGSTTIACAPGTVSAGAVIAGAVTFEGTTATITVNSVTDDWSTIIMTFKAAVSTRMQNQGGRRGRSF